MTNYNQNELAKTIKKMNKQLGTSKVPSLKSTNKTKTLSDQYANYQKRLAGSGIDSSKADSRNPLEKLLNLTPDQNFISDIFEIINRPQQALFGGISEAQQGGDFFEGAKEGLTGERYTPGGELLRNIGFEDSEGLGLDDTLGLALDFIADPVNLISVGTAGTVSKIAGKNAKAVSKIDDLAKAGKLFDKTGATLDTINLADNLRSGLGYVKDYSGKLKPFTPSPKVLDVLETGKDTASIFDLATKPAMYGTKKGLGLIDKSLTKYSPAYQAFSNTLKGTFNASRKLATDVISKVNYTKGMQEPLSFLNKGELAVYNDALEPVAERLVGKVKGIDDIGKAKNYVNNLLYETGQALAIKDINEVPVKKLINLFTDESGARHTLLNKGGVLNEFFDELVALRMIDEDSFKKLVGSNGDEYINLSKNGAKQLNNIANKESSKLRGYFNSRQKVILEQALEGGEKAITDKNTVGAIKRLINTGKLPKALFNVSDSKVLMTDLGKKKLSDLMQMQVSAKELVEALIPNVFKPTADDLDNLLAEVNKVAPELEGYITNNLFQRIKDNVRETLGVGFAKDDYLARNVNKELKSYINELSKNPITRANLASINNVKGNLSSSSILKESTTDFMTSKQYNDIVRNMKEVSLLPFDYDPNQGVNAIEAIAENLGLKSKDGVEKVEKLLSLYDKGVLEEDYMSNAMDFLKKYSNASSDAKIMDLALVAPLKDEFVNLQNSIKLKQPYDIKNKIFVPVDLVPEKLKPTMVGYTKLNGADIKQLIKRIDQTALFNPETKPMFEEVIKVLNNKKITKGGAYIDSHIAEMVKFLGEKDAAPKFWEGVTGLTDKVNTIFKKGKLLSPTYNVRNVVGGLTNLTMSGIPLNEAISLSLKNAKTIKNIDNALSFIANGGKYATMSDELKKAWDLFTEFSSAGFTKDIGLQLNDLTNVLKSGQDVNPNILKKVINTANEANAKANVYVDNLFRLTAIDYFSKNPDKVLKLGFDNAGDVARWAMFDPSDLSKVEKEYIKKLIPFYTFAKKNLAFQFQNLQANPDKYYKLKRSLDSLWTASGVEDPRQLQDYQLNSSMIPLPFLSDNNTINYLKASLPTSDIFEWASNPVERLVNVTSPIIKAPFELATGVNTFTGRPIEQYKGEMSQNIPFLTKKGEWGLGQFGLDVPLRTVTNLASLPFADSDTFNDKFNRGTGLLGSTSQEKIRNARLYKQIDDIKAYINKLKDSGTNIKSLDEINSNNKSLSAINAKIAQLKK